MNDDYKAIRDRVREYVKRAGITQDALADKVGIKRSTFYNRLSGRSPWFFDEVKNLSRVMGVSLDEISR